MRRWSGLALLAIGTAFGPGGAFEPVTIEIPCRSEYTFGRQMAFFLDDGHTLDSRPPTLILTAASSQADRYEAQLASEDPTAWTAIRDLQAQPVFPFTIFQFHWEWRDSAGTDYRSAVCVAQYADDRYEWTMYEKESITVYRNTGDVEQAENAAELIALTAAKVAEEFGRPWPIPVRAYWYSSVQEMQTGLGGRLAGFEGAVSDPSSGNILVAASPGVQGRRTLAILLPHETVHLILNRTAEGAAASLPFWLGEGLAVRYEMEARPELERVMSQTTAGGVFLAMESLCEFYPSGEQAASLAYAESRAFVEYLESRFGKERLRAAVDRYQAGAGCEAGFADTYGITLAEAGRDWRESLSPAADPVKVALIGIAAITSIWAALLLIRYLYRRRTRSKTPDS